MPSVPTRWRHLVRDHLDASAERVARAERHLADEDGTRAVQEAYPAVVTLSTIRVWLDAPPWVTAIAADTMPRRVQQQLPGLFAALTELDVQHALTRPWQAADARPYVEEARTLLDDTRVLVDRWIESDR
jgi:phage terminase Nu1 subunit (DNA packaging protein)